MATFRPGLGETGDLASIREAAGITGSFSAELKQINEEMRTAGREAKSLSTALGGSLKTAFDKLIFDGAKLSDVLRGLGRSVSGKVLNAAIAPVQNALGTGISGLVQGGVSSLLSGFSLFADGAAFSSGNVRAFAGGGVVDGPTLFPMRGGTGLMGEAGPEAIMPLQRGPDGRLGVAASGRSRGGNVTVNIQTPDIAGFQRSRSQVAAQLSRAVAFGRRNQ